MKEFSTKKSEKNPQIPSKKKIDIIKEYLSSQPEQIQKLESISKIIHNIITNFIDITHNYSSQLEKLALSIVPNYTTEGQLAQAVQSILLFYSEGLNNLISELKKKHIKFEDNEENSIINKFKEQRNTYYQKVRNAIIFSEKYKKELELYQEYLINEQFNEHIKKNDFINNDDDIIFNKIKAINELEKDENDDNKIISNKSLESFNDIGINKIDNKNKVIEKQKLFLANISESNDIFNKIKEFLSQEKTKIRNNIFDICNCLIEGLLMYAKSQKDSYDIQNDVIKKLTKKLSFEETDKNQIIPAIFKLKYLEIYKDYIEEKKEIFIHNHIKKTNTAKNSSYKNKDGNKELGYMKKNFYNHPRKNTVNFSEIGNVITKEEIIEKFNYMIKNLNRDDIIKIFEIIKSSNIKLLESDINFIEQLKNYKIIHEILVTIFINPEEYSEKENNILINFFEQDKIYILYFIKVLNDHRTKGNFLLSENTLKYLGKLFQFINNLIVNKNDMELFKFVFILSLTYYHISEKNDMKKIYLFSYIKDHPYYQKEKFWEDYLNELIKHELKGNNFNLEVNLKDKTIEKMNKKEKEILINCNFSNFLTVAKAMADFSLDKKFVRDFVEKNKEKYFLSQEQIENICMIYDISLNENKNNYNDNIDFLDIENLNKSKNSKNLDINNEENKNNDNNNIMIIEGKKKEEKDKINIDKNEEKEINNKDDINITNKNDEDNRLLNDSEENDKK